MIKVSDPGFALMNSTAHILGETATDIELDTSEQASELTQELVSQANRSIDIYSQQLTAAIYSNPQLVDSLKRCLLLSPRNQIRILLVNPDSVIKKRHHMQDLIQRMTSNLSLRKIHPDYAINQQDFIVVDGRGVLRRKHGDRFEGIANFNDPALGKELTDYFDEVWNHSQFSPDLRRLYI